MRNGWGGVGEEQVDAMVVPLRQSTTPPGLVPDAEEDLHNACAAAERFYNRDPSDEAAEDAPLWQFLREKMKSERKFSGPYGLAKNGRIWMKDKSVAVIVDPLLQSMLPLCGRRKATLVQLEGEISEELLTSSVGTSS